MGILNDLNQAESKALLDLVKSRRLAEDADGLVHALADIAESINKVYFDLLPKLLSDPDASQDVLKDRLWDIREEFRHIDYHIHAGNLTEL